MPQIVSYKSEVLVFSSFQKLIYTFVFFYDLSLNLYLYTHVVKCSMETECYWLLCTSAMNMYTYSTCIGVKTASHAGHCPISLVNVG